MSLALSSNAKTAISLSANTKARVNDAAISRAEDVFRLRIAVAFEQCLINYKSQ